MSEAAAVTNNFYYPPTFNTEGSRQVTAQDIVASQRAQDEFHDRSVDVIADYIHEQIDASGDPEAVSAQRHAMVDDMASGAKVNGAGGDFGLDIEEFMAKSLEWFRKEIAESNEDTQAGEGSGGKGKNWLVAVMAALSKIAGDHLARTVEISEEIGGLESETQSLEGVTDETKRETIMEENKTTRSNEASKMTALQGEMQAEMQLFKMSFEAAASLGKTVGQGFQSMARAQ